MEGWINKDLDPDEEINNKKIYIINRSVNKKSTDTKMGGRKNDNFLISRLAHVCTYKKYCVYFKSACVLATQ